MELAHFGDLLKFSNSMVMSKKNYSEATLRRWLRQILEALIYIHLHHGVHRDIKPNNILVFGENRDDLDTLYVKLTDFGSGKMFLESMQMGQTAVGTFGYMAPEMC